jgi:hypothetical protein
LVIRARGGAGGDDADRFSRDLAMRQLIGGRAVKHDAASPSAMGRVEVEILARPRTLANPPGRWIGAVHDRRLRSVVMRERNSSESCTHGGRLRPPRVVRSSGMAEPGACGPKLRECRSRLAMRHPGRPAHHVVRRRTGVRTHAKSLSIARRLAA